jgi:hypothetical protein
MSLKSRIKDSFPSGLMLGSLLLIIFYLLINFIRLRLIAYYNDPYILRPPTVQLFCMVLNVLVFRWMMINMEKEKTGKGILFVTVLSVFVYFFIFYRHIHKL